MTATAIIGRHLERGDLTGQQRRVMAGLLRGRTIGEVAMDLGLSLKTVYWHLARIRERCKVQGYELIVYCYQHRDCCRGEFDP